MSQSIYSYYRTSNGDHYISSSPRSECDEELELVPTYSEWQELEDRCSDLEGENSNLDSQLEELQIQHDTDYDEALELFLQDLATQVNTYGHDPISIISDALKKYGLYLEMRRAA